MQERPQSQRPLADKVAGRFLAGPNARAVLALHFWICLAHDLTTPRQAFSRPSATAHELPPRLFPTCSNSITPNPAPSASWWSLRCPTQGSASTPSELSDVAASLKRRPRGDYCAPRPLEGADVFRGNVPLTATIDRGSSAPRSSPLKAFDDFPSNTLGR
jgi:hypothetical protein